MNEQLKHAIQLNTVQSYKCSTAFTS